MGYTCYRMHWSETQRVNDPLAGMTSLWVAQLGRGNKSSNVTLGEASSCGMPSVHGIQSVLIACLHGCKPAVLQLLLHHLCAGHDGVEVVHQQLPAAFDSADWKVDGCHLASCCSTLSCYCSSTCWRTKCFLCCVSQLLGRNYFYLLVACIQQGDPANAASAQRERQRHQPAESDKE